MALAIAIKPVPESAAPQGMDDSAPSESGQAIVDAVKGLSEDELTALIHGISPDALSVMQKIPDLAPLADFIGNGDPSADASAPPVPSPAPTDARSQVASAMKANGVRGGY